MDEMDESPRLTGSHKLGGAPFPEYGYTIEKDEDTSPANVIVKTR